MRPMNKQIATRDVRSRRWGGRLLVALLVGTTLLVSRSSAEEEAGIDQTRTALEQWVQNRRTIAKEKRDWALGKEVLNNRIEIVQNEIASLRSKIDAESKKVDTAEAERAELEQQSRKLKQATEELEGTVVELEGRIKRLLPRLPMPIRERVKPLSQRIPENPEETEQTVSERFVNVVGILQEVNKFNNQITHHIERRTLPDGTTAEVTTLYLGIGRAYYVNAEAGVAGTGTASADGWAWTPADDQVAVIARAIAIIKGERPASYVPVSLEVQ